jgi:vanillate/3-O-methylgallate O-demethylase
LAQSPRRTAVSLLWNKEDILKIVGSMLEPGLACKAINWPAASYSWQQNDEVRSPDGRLIGLAAFSGYTINENEIISLALIDQAYATQGTRVVLTWGEPNGGSRKPHVERHKQMQVRATVAPKPYAKAVQKLQRSGLS